jgi:ribosomal protein L37AE/L43A
MSIERQLQEFETIQCSKCKMTEMELYSNLWCCSNCGYNMRQNEMINKKKYISKNKLKKYILNQMDENMSHKIIAVYLKKEGYSNDIFNNHSLIGELLMDLKTNPNNKTHKLFNLKNIIN